MKALHAVFFAAMSMAALGVWASAPAWGDAAPLKDTAAFSFEISPGFHLNSLRGYRGKVGEYEVLDDGAEIEFLLNGHEGDTSLRLYGDMQDKNDQLYRLRIAKGATVLTRFNYSRFQHYLDHDTLENQNFVTDTDKFRSNSLVIEDMAASNELGLPSLPFVKLLLDWRSYSKRGHRQATTVSGCTQCHVSSENRRVSTQLQDMTAGIQADVGPATITYAHRWRSFRESGGTPVTAYRETNDFYPSVGSQPYGAVTDSMAGENKIQFSSPLPLASFLSSSIRWDELKNSDTRQKVSFRNFSSLISKTFSRYVSGNAFYVKTQTHATTPGGISRMQQRGGFTVAARPPELGVVNVSCQWEETDRRNFEINTTDKQLYRLGYRQRLYNHIQFYGSYEKKHTDDQFLRRDPLYAHLAKTALPDDEDTVQTSATWEPAERMSLGASFRYISSTYRDYHVDESRWEYGMSGWWSPAKNLSLTAAWTCTDTDISTPATFSAWHYGGRTTLFFTDTIPYDSRSMLYYGSISYRLSPHISLNGQFSRVSSVAEFDASVADTNIGRYSDLNIVSTEYSFGMSYQYNKRLSFYTKYKFREYDDKNISCLDGRYDFISLGMNWSL